MPETECECCEESKPIHRYLTVTDKDGTVLDTVGYCEKCWPDIKRDLSKIGVAA